MSADPSMESGTSTRAKLAELAVLLREVDHLDPDLRDRLGGLVDELDTALHGDVSPEVARHVTTTAEELVAALRDRENSDGLSSALARARDATATVEAETPGPLGPALSALLEILNTLGI